MSVQRLRAFSLIVSLVVLTSCGTKKNTGPKIDKVPVVPVAGEITVDGKPELGVIIQCIPQSTPFAVPGKESALIANTDKDGKFKMRVYEDEEGLPPGDYALIAYWPTISFKKRSETEKRDSDRFKSKYSTVEKAPTKFKVESGKPLKLDLIDLKTK